MDYRFYFIYTLEGRVKRATEPNADFDFTFTENKNGIRAVLKPKRPITVNKFYIERDYKFKDGAKFFANGFQSWTDTKEFVKTDKMDGIGRIGRSIYGRTMGMDAGGDYNFVNEEKTAGAFHSNGIAYIRTGDNIDFYGSKSDRTGYTIIYADMNKNTLTFSKDIEGIVIEKPYEILNVFHAEGEYDWVFDRYFEAIDVKPLTDKKLKGYTSWYNYYEKINEKVILRDLEALAPYREEVGLYQIDDGFETAVGDWFSIDKKKFPHGLKYVADAIHEKGFKAGLWLAPFGAKRNSKLAKEHPDWLVTGLNGQIVPVGHNWGGFYALDIYNEEARAYIKSVFDTVFNEWGFDMVKLDFLYAAATIPMHGKTRGEIAYDAIDLIRECCGEHPILACGAQQLPCFGKVEYMRIGADMSLGWPHTFLRRNMHREDVSTPNAIANSIYRRGFNGRAFLCDSDVFLLRRTNIKFTPQQQALLAQFIKIFGKVLLMSDNIADYDEEQLKMFHHIMDDDDTALSDVKEDGGVVTVNYIENGENKQLKFNYNDGTIY